MTNENKEKIILMRKSNMSFSDIGKVLGLSAETVRSFYSRHGSDTEVANHSMSEERTESSDATYCRRCGRKIVQNPKNKPKIFCSDVCRVIWWSEHAEKIRHKVEYRHICPSCGKEFTVFGNSKRKYCSHACYVTDRFGGAK